MLYGLILLQSWPRPISQCPLNKIIDTATLETSIQWGCEKDPQQYRNFMSYAMRSGYPIGGIILFPPDAHPYSLQNFLDEVTHNSLRHSTTPQLVIDDAYCMSWGVATFFWMAALISRFPIIFLKQNFIGRFTALPLLPSDDGDAANISSPSLDLYAYNDTPESATENGDGLDNIL